MTHPTRWRIRLGCGFTLTLTDEVIVTGSAELVLDIFDRERRARYTGGSGRRPPTRHSRVRRGRVWGGQGFRV